MRVWFFAPRGVSGGIATWAQTLEQSISSDICLEWIDTARHYQTLGSGEWTSRLYYGLVSAAKRHRTASAIIRAGRPGDVIYLNVSPNLGLWVRDFPLILRFRRAGFSIVVHLHGGSLVGFFGRRWPLTAIARYTYRSAAALICITRTVEVAATRIVPPQRVQAIPNMIPRHPEAKAEDRRDPVSPPTVLHVGAQSAAKGTFEVLRVAKILPHVRFRLVGPIASDVRVEIDDLMRRLGGLPNVTLVGEKRHEMLTEEFSRADILLFPSHGEGFPMVVLEAMTHGVAVIASDVGAIPEMLGTNEPDSAGVVLPLETCRNATAVATEVERLLRDDVLRHEFGTRGRRRTARYYSTDAVVPKIERVIASVSPSSRY